MYTCWQSGQADQGDLHQTYTIRLAKETEQKSHG